MEEEVERVQEGEVRWKQPAQKHNLHSGGGDGTGARLLQAICTYVKTKK